jgi:hypothetical protein
LTKRDGDRAFDPTTRKCDECGKTVTGQLDECQGRRGIVTATVVDRLRADGDAARKTKVFISYSRKDMAFERAGVALILFIALIFFTSSR